MLNAAAILLLIRGSFSGLFVKRIFVPSWGFDFVDRMRTEGSGEQCGFGRRLICHSVEVISGVIAVGERRFGLRLLAKMSGFYWL